MARTIKAKSVGANQDVPWTSRAQVYNNSGASIAASDLVYVTGQRGLVMEVTKADADVALADGATLWVARHEIPNGEYGEILPWRLVTGVNTAGSTAGQPVYLSSTAGGWSLTPGATAIVVGTVSSVHASTGSVLLNPQGGATSGKAYASTADSAVLAQNTAVTAFSVTHSIPAGKLVSGSVLKIRAVVRITEAMNGGATVDARLRLGSAVIIQSGESTGSVAETRCVLEGTYTFRADPAASVAFAGVGTAIWSDTAAVVTTDPSASDAVPTAATNGALVVDVAASASATGTGSGKYVLEQLIVEIS
jgi:uncharacterized cupin superfamily protein